MIFVISTGHTARAKDKKVVCDQLAAHLQRGRQKAHQAEAVDWGQLKQVSLVACTTGAGQSWGGDFWGEAVLPQVASEAHVVVGGAKDRPGNEFSTFILDSGATAHMVGANVALHNAVPTTGPVRFGNDEVLDASEIGNLQLGRLMPTEVLRVNGISRNLLSEGQLDDSAAG